MFRHFQCLVLVDFMFGSDRFWCYHFRHISINHHNHHITNCMWKSYHWTTKRIISFSWNYQVYVREHSRARAHIQFIFSLSLSLCMSEKYKMRWRFEIRSNFIEHRHICRNNICIDRNWCFVCRFFEATLYTSLMKLFLCHSAFLAFGLNVKNFIKVKSI